MCSVMKIFVTSEKAEQSRDLGTRETSRGLDRGRGEFIGVGGEVIGEKEFVTRSNETTVMRGVLRMG